MWPCHLINLADNRARLDRSAAEFSRLGLEWHRIEAIDGRKLPKEEIVRVYDAERNARRGKHPLVPAEIGCYLSHIAVWDRIAQGKAPGGFVFEDDFSADDSLPEALVRLSDNPEDWDMVKLFSFDPSPRLVRSRDLGAGFRLGIPYRVPTCLIGYGLTRRAAARLRDRALPFFRPVDEDQKFFWETGLRVAVVLPTPVHVGNQQADTGTISDSRRTDAMTRRHRGQGRWLHKLGYQLGYRAQLHYHRLMGHGQ